MNDPAAPIEIEEYEPKMLPRNRLSAEIGKQLWEVYKTRIQVEFPGPPTDDQWRLTSQGWIGYIPLAEDVQLFLTPKVALGNVFRMLEYAYRLNGFEILEDTFNAGSLAELYEQIALLLAKRILDRERKGFYRAYVSEQNEMPFIRGRIDMRTRMTKPWATRLNCSYDEHTADIEDNQILAWTLFTISRSGLCTERTAPTIRQAYRHLAGLVSPNPKYAHDCVGRRYHRLNQDYHPLHALCRFFLENSGPTHHLGKREMVPFLIDMARLYELFVAEWLEAHLPDGFELRIQEEYQFSHEGNLDFRIDLVLYDSATQQALAVMDTKYKRTKYPSPDDIQQIVTYATAKKCREAVLVYPSSNTQRLDQQIGDIRVRSLVFRLDGDIEQAGEEFLRNLMNNR